MNHLFGKHGISVFNKSIDFPVNNKDTSREISIDDDDSTSSRDTTISSADALLELVDSFDEIDIEEDKEESIYVDHDEISKG